MFIFFVFFKQMKISARNSLLNDRIEVSKDLGGDVCNHVLNNQNYFLDSGASTHDHRRVLYFTNAEYF